MGEFEGVTKREPSCSGTGNADLLDRLWLYTNFDCNLNCRYCVTKSTPETPRLPLGRANFERLVEEARKLAFNSIFITGGEPFLLEDIFEMLSYSIARLKTTVLTNGTLFPEKRLGRLRALAGDNLSVQVSLDGGRAVDHDAYRGRGTWKRTFEGIRRLRASGIHVIISTTQTPANATHMEELHELCRSLGIAEEDCFIRPLARYGFSREGYEIERTRLFPEVTVTAEGVFWHPLVFPGNRDMLVSNSLFPLADAVDAIRREIASADADESQSMKKFT